MTAAFLAYLIENGEVERHVSEMLQPSYAKREHILRSAVERSLIPQGVSIADHAAISGGFFLWLTLPGGITANEVAAMAASEENLIVASGSMFEVWGDEDAARFQNNIRLSYAWEPEDALREGIERLAKVIGRLKT